MPYTIEQEQTYFDKYFQDKKPKLCKYYDKNIQDYVYFIKKPKYDEVSKADEENYRYVPQKHPYEKMQQTSDLQLRTRVAVSALQSVIKDGKDLSYSDECTIKQRIDINLYSMLWIVELCDSLIKNNKYYCFELIYHYGNLNFEKYLANSDLLPRYFIKYISDVTRDSHLEGVSTLLESMTLEEIKKLVCTRKLKLTDSQQKKIYCIKILDGSPVIEKNDAIFLETLFSLGAISLTQVQAMKIIRYAGYELIAPQIAKVAKGSLPDFHLVNINEYPFKDKDDYEEAMKQIRTKMVDQKLAEIEEREKERAKEAEDEMDKIFAEAQKNIEMER